MKSFLRFLNRNKVYSSINILGFSFSLMAIILLAAYVWKEYTVNRQVENADRILVVANETSEGEKFTGSHWRMQYKLRQQYPQIENSCAVKMVSSQLHNQLGEPINTRFALVDSSFFSVFNFRLLEGNPKEVLRQPNAAVVTPEYAKKMFGNTNPIGQHIAYQDSINLVVTGVMEPIRHTSLMSPDRKPLDLLMRFEYVKYLNYSCYNEEMSNSTGAEVFLLMKKGATLEGKEKDIIDYLKGFYWFYKLPGYDIRMKLIPFSKVYFSGYVSSDMNSISGDLKMVKVLFIVTLVILLFSMMNYINLTVAQSVFRTREMGTRLLLGSQRWQIIMRLIYESTLLSLFSLAVGFLLALLFEPLAGAVLGSEIHLLQMVTPQALLLLVGTAVLIGILAGCAPAFITSAVNPLDIVRGGLRRKSKMVYGKIFITLQNIITISMISAALMMYLQIRHLISAPLGYQTKDIMELNEDISQAFVNELEKQPFVEMVSLSCGTPLTMGNNSTFIKDGRTVSLQHYVGDNNFMKIYGLKVEKQTGNISPGAVYVNRQLCSELNLPADAQGFNFFDEVQPIKGVIRDIHLGTILTEQHPIFIQISDRWKFYPWNIIIKTRGNHVEAEKRVRELYKKVNQVELMANQLYLEDMIKDRFKSDRRILKIMGIFSLIAILISMLGLIAMSTFYIQQRRKDIAVRKVMGCSSREVLTKLMGTFVVYVLIAFVIAVPLVYYLMETWLSTYAYRISFSWLAIAAVGVAVLLVAVIAVFAQSYIASNMNPVKNLNRNE